MGGDFYAHSFFFQKSAGSVLRNLLMKYDTPSVLEYAGHGIFYNHTIPSGFGQNPEGVE